MGSMIALAARVAAVRALRGATAVSDNRILDSAMLPIDQMATQEPQPFIVVSTEDETSQPDGRDINNGTRTLDLVIELGLAQGVEIELPPAEGGGTAVAVSVPNTDAGLELSMAIIGRQIFNCLFGRGGGIWGHAFRELAGNVQRLQSRRGVPTKDGQRFAARQWIFTLQPIAEPAVGQVLEGTPLALFFAAAEADEDFNASVASAIRAAIEGVPADWPAVYDAAALLGGYTDREGQMLGFGLVEPPAEPGEEPLLAEVVEYNSGAVANADTVAEQLPE